MELEIYSDIEDTLGYAESKFSNLQSWYEDVLHPEDKSTVLNDYANWMRAGAEGTLSRAYRLRNRGCGQYMWVCATAHAREIKMNAAGLTAYLVQ